MPSSAALLVGEAEVDVEAAGSSIILRRAFDFGAGLYLTRDPVSSSNKRN